MAKLAVNHAEGKGRRLTLCSRTVIEGIIEAAIQRVGGSAAKTKAFQFHPQTGIRELVVGIVGMTGEVATPIGLIVAGTGIHIYRSVPVVADAIGILVEQQIICRSSETAARIGFLHAVAPSADIMKVFSNIIVSNTGIGGNIRVAVRGIAMTESAVQGKDSCRIVAAKTTDPDPANAVKGSTMTKGTCILDIGRRVMERVIRPGPVGVGRMGVVDAVTTLTACTVDTIDANVKTGITPWSAGLSMAGLTGCQVSLGIRAMICRIQIGTIHWMWYLVWPVGMTGKAVEIGGEAAGSPLTALQLALQLIAMAIGARGKTIGSGISTMVDIRIYPRGRVNDKRWYVVVGVAGIAADRLAASMQVCTMADDALCVSGNSQGILGMRVDITRRMWGIIRGSTGISVGTPRQGQGQEW